MSLRERPPSPAWVSPNGQELRPPQRVGFAVEAIELALEDAGLSRSDLDGILVNPGLTWGSELMASYTVQQAMGIRTSA